MGADVHSDGAGGVPGENLHDIGMHARPRERGKVGMAMLMEAVDICACKRSSIRKPILPFTDWQNDLHLIVDIAHSISLCSRIDLAKLIGAATRAFSGAHSIGSCEDRSGYVCR